MTLHRLLRAEQAVTPEMALRLGRLCGNGPELWLRMQMGHDLWRLERHPPRQPRPHPEPRRGVREAPAPASNFPVDRLASGYDAIWQASAKDWTSLL